MACGCSKRNRNSAKAAGGGALGAQVYQVTLPGEAEPTEYLTPLEAKKAIRRAGGGTIKRVSQAPPSSAA